jgi:hypothetical protein
MKQEIEFNCNEMVKVKLTSYGKECLRKNHERKMSRYAVFAYPFELPEEDEEGYASFQLWCLMKEFGEYMDVGIKNPFNMGMKLIKE